MNFDFAKTLSLIKGGLLDYEATWNTYLEESPGWQQTLVVLTGPLLVASIVLSTLFSQLFGGFSAFAYSDNFFTALFIGLITAALGFAIAVFVFNFLSGVFKGEANFDRAFAALSLAAIPAWVAGALAPVIPFVGMLVSLAGGICSLVFMYKIIPLALRVPAEKRVVHFIASLVVTLVVNMIIASVTGIGGMGSQMRGGSFSNSGPVKGSGMLADIERQSQLMEAAGADVFTPPADGELTESQLEDYVKVLGKTRVMQEEYAAKMRKASEEMEAKKKEGESPSFSDLSTMYSGMSSVMSVNNAEMEIVKTGGGNWAEHIWIKEQLRVAKVQQGDGSDAFAHNYELYQEYQQELEGTN